MKKYSYYFDLIDPVDSDSTVSIVHPECYVVGVSRHALFMNHTYDSSLIYRIIKTSDFAVW